MDQLKNILNEILNLNLLTIIISGVRSDCETTKIKIRPVVLKNELKFQATSYVGTKVLHANYDAGALAQEIMVWMERDFKQLQASTRTEDITVLVSKKGKMTIKRKKNAAAGAAPGSVTPTAQAGAALSGITPAAPAGAPNQTACAAPPVPAGDPFAMLAAHNRQKRYILQEGIPVDFLVDLGVMTPQGKVVKARYDKFRQINRFLEFIEDILPQLPKSRQIHIIDFGCGKSYLTFAMYYYLKELAGYDIAITGLDLKKDVIARCNDLARRYGYDGLKFLHGDIASYEGTDSVDMVVTLHACDTATDYALYKAVRWNARVILSVPCCQHELNRQLQCDGLSAVLQYGILKERMAALCTDGLRAELLNAAGYKTQLLEFIDMEHTPKNILIRAVRERRVDRFVLSEKYEQCRSLLNVSPTLEQLLTGMEWGK